MRKALLLCIQNYLSSLKNNDGEQPIWIRLWNSDEDELVKYDDKGQAHYNIQFPAVLVEPIVNETQQLGTGFQLYDLDVILHILHYQKDAGDETNLNQNTDVFDFANTIYTLVQKQWGVDAQGNKYPFGMLGRIGETEDNKHGSVYRFKQRYTTTYIDSGMKEPVKGITTSPPTGIDLSGVVIDDNPSDYTIS